jgi:CMP-2-keto-3-deoxyoctulosonic acid synthetase
MKLIFEVVSNKTFHDKKNPEAAKIILAIAERNIYGSSTLIPYIL